MQAFNINFVVFLSLLKKLTITYSTFLYSRYKVRRKHFENTRTEINFYKNAEENLFCGFQPPELCLFASFFRHD